MNEENEKACNRYAYTIIQNLKDAGCTEETVKRFMELDGGGDEESKVKLLNAHRKRLLDKLHRDERKIDCLDYLLYQIQNKH